MVSQAPCDACGEPFALRAESCPRCGFPRNALVPRLSGPTGAKSPRSAMWLSLLWPGAGHFYAGNSERGLLFGGIALAGALLSFALGPVLPMLMWLGLSLYTAIDAGRLISGSPAR